jgi:hypothetical protein
MNDFTRLSGSLKKNISEVRVALKDPDHLQAGGGRAFERTVYLFQSIAKSMIDIGNSIVIENDFRSPLNTADVFISLAEHNIIPPSIVPGLKKTAMIMPKIQSYDNGELLAIMNGCMSDINRCLDSFIKYHHVKSRKE